MKEALSEWHILGDGDVVILRNVLGVEHDGIVCVDGAKNDGAMSCGLVIVLSHYEFHTLCVRKRLDDGEQMRFVLGLGALDEATREDRGAVCVFCSEWCGWSGEKRCAWSWCMCVQGTRVDRAQEKTEIIRGGGLIACSWRWRRWRRRR